MASWSFNPFTGNLDLVGSGGGAVVFEGEVETFADLPEAVGNPPVGSSYLVRASTGVWLVNKRQSGIWIRRNNTGVRATDWEYGGDYPVNSVNGQTGNIVLAASDVGGVPTSRTVTAGTGLTGGGDLTANRTLAVSYGSTSGTACEGNDARLSDARTPTSHTHTAADINSQTAANGTVLTANGSGGSSFAALPASGVSAVGASAADILSVSGSDLVADDPNADRLVFWDDSASKLAYLEAGSGLSISGTTITATASGGSKTYARWIAGLENCPPATGFGTLDTRSSIPCIDLDDASTESAIFMGVMPEGAVLTSGVIVNLYWTATTATSGNVRFSVSLERGTTDLDSDSFDTAVAQTEACASTSGIIKQSSITVTTIDSIVAGDFFRLRVQRLGGDGADSMSGDCELIAVEVRSAA